MIKGIIFDWIGTLYDRNTGIYPYSERVLAMLKPDYKLGLVSLAKQGVERRQQQLRESGILHYFDSVIVETNKNEETFRTCMRQMGTAPQTTAVVDDRTKRGIMIGNKLGCTTFWICQGEYAHEFPSQETGEPTYQIDTIEDLVGLFRP